jgi:hypothetical protein
MAQVVEHLSSKMEAQSSNLILPKKDPAMTIRFSKMVMIGDLKKDNFYGVVEARLLWGGGGKV